MMCEGIEQHQSKLDSTSPQPIPGMVDTELKLRAAGHPATAIRRFAVDGGLLLLDKNTNTLFAYNEVAGRIWDAMQAHRPEGEIAAEIAAEWGIPAARAQDDV